MVVYLIKEEGRGENIIKWLSDCIFGELDNATDSNWVKILRFTWPVLAGSGDSEPNENRPERRSETLKVSFNN